MSDARSLFALGAALCVGLGAPFARADGSDEHARTSQTTHDPAPGTFVADDWLRSFRETYAAGEKPHRREPHYLRAGLEQLIVLAAGTTYYWVRPEPNKADWDYSSLGDRMANLEVTFDTNLHVTNSLLHPIAGGLYYGFARVNGLSIPAAFAYSAATSAAFEFLLEIYEKPSINDLILTPTGGMTMGEFFLHLGEYASSAPGGGKWGHKAASWVLGMPQHLHMGEPFSAGKLEMPADSLGFSSFYTHRFATLLGVARSTSEDGRIGDSLDLRLEGELAAVPGLLRPGRFGFTFSDGNFTETRMHFARGHGTGLSVDVFFDANLAGLYRQNVGVVDGVRRGSAMMLAVDSSLKFSERRLGNRYDAYAVANLIGPAFKLWAVYGDLVATLDGATQPDFASIYSIAFSQWATQFGTEGTKSVLQKEAYYYAYGWSGRLRGTVAYRGVELGSRAFFGTYGSIDRWDRFQENVTRDPHLTDQVTELEAWIGLTTPTIPFHGRIFAEHFGRHGNMESVSMGRWDRRVGIMLGAQF